MKYLLAGLGGMVLGFVVAGFLITDEWDNERNRNIHLSAEIERLKRQLNPPHYS